MSDEAKKDRTSEATEVATLDAIIAAFDEYEEALERAQRWQHNCEFWTDEQSQPIYNAGGKLRDIVAAAKSRRPNSATEVAHGDVRGSGASGREDASAVADVGGAAGSSAGPNPPGTHDAIRDAFGARVGGSARERVGRVVAYVTTRGDSREAARVVYPDGRVEDVMPSDRPSDATNVTRHGDPIPTGEDGACAAYFADAPKGKGFECPYHGRQPRAVWQSPECPTVASAAFDRDEAIWRSREIAQRSMRSKERETVPGTDYDQLRREAMLWRAVATGFRLALSDMPDDEGTEALEDAQTAFNDAVHEFGHPNYPGTGQKRGDGHG